MKTSQVFFVAVIALNMLFGAAVFGSESGRAMEAGGSNFVAFDLDLERLKEKDAWFDRSIFKTVVCQYKGNESNIQAELNAMFASGQRKIALMLWFLHLDHPENCAGYVLDSSSGQIPVADAENLSVFIKAASEIGFDEIQIRFAPMGKNDPKEWKAWNDGLYAENWGFIHSTIVAVSDSAFEKIKVIYDLGVELGGLSGPSCLQCENYVQKLWADFNNAFPNKISYGFSIAFGAGRTSTLLKDLDDTGYPTPREIAIDVYSHPYEALGTVAYEMRALHKNLSVLIQETFYDDPATYDELTKAAKDNGLTLRAIMQWPLKRDIKTHISESETPDYIYFDK